MNRVDLNLSNTPYHIKMFKLGAAVIVFIILVIGLFNLFELNGANTIMVIQSPIKGTFHWFTSAGVKWQGFGRVTKYPKREIYEFKTQVRFNDGGHGTMFGSVSYELPLDEKNLSNIHMKFGSIKSLENQLISTVVSKAIYMTGPLMSSKESYAEKRNYLIQYVEDQVQNGVYRTVSKEVKMVDPMTGVDKTVTVVEICVKGGVPERQEEAAMAVFGIKTFNFSIKELPYDGDVEKQIKQQQSLAMDVQTSIASAKKAEQNAITVAKEGEANAARAKWEQEVIKARAVVESQQQLEVARLNKEAAEFTKQQQILLGQGEAERKKLVMAADGALEKKLETYKEVQKMWAEAFSNFGGSIVPNTVMGGSFSGQNGATSFMDIMTAKAARDLSLDMSVPAVNKLNKPNTINKAK
jgi:hypothetical protein